MNVKRDDRGLPIESCPVCGALDQWLVRCGDCGYRAGDGCCYQKHDCYWVWRARFDGRLGANR